MLFGLANYALYVFAQQNKPRKAGKRVSTINWAVSKAFISEDAHHACVTFHLPHASDL